MDEQVKERLGLSYVIAQGPNTADEMVAAAKLAEECGFYSVFVPEHYYDREAPSILGAIAQYTRKIKIGTGVINP
ncbi:MAG: LLM class flavin-dependent oxidoreductase, partial [Thaumarchaeota archaeon]|nr:LLM class flavin-dependent oxidoreductase [Nitrososphaerota archaeon]